MSAPPGTGGFPDGFLWGAATSAYQIEGSPLADGAGPSTWHRFSRIPGATVGGPEGDVACDHYRLWREDVDLMAGLGLGAYRFSIAWGRILPEGRGSVNQRGLDFYRRLVDRLLERGIRPFATLFHWDFPTALEDRGGWLDRDAASWFGDYARVCYRALGDRVPLWSTLNEPWVVVDAGYLHGVHAPGHRSRAEAPRAGHHLLLAHAAGVEAFRAEGRPGGIGIVVNLEPKDPASDRPEDLAATRIADATMNRHYLDAVLLGRYPDELAEAYGDDWPVFPAGDLARIAAPIDFLGVNYYTRSVVRSDPGAWAFGFSAVPQTGRLHTETGWEVHPASFTRCLIDLKARYGGLPIYITENGAAFADPPSAAGGAVDDPLRVDYLRAHLRAAREAVRGSVDLRGYFVWSLLDNVEWSLGTSRRFGIVHVDYATQVRTLKASAHFYREVIATRGAALDA